MVNSVLTFPKLKCSKDPIPRELVNNKPPAFLVCLLFYHVALETATEVIRHALKCGSRPKAGLSCHLMKPGTTDGSINQSKMLSHLVHTPLLCLWYFKRSTVND